MNTDRHSFAAYTEVSSPVCPGETCWQSQNASRIAFLVDGASYFRAAKAAMENAQESIFIIAWDFHGHTRLDPGGSERLDAFLNRLAEERPRLRIRVLKWGMPLAMALPMPRMPLPLLRQFAHARVDYRIDDVHPPGASHHQKIVVIDDAIAFCGGSDLCADRWDTPDHRDNNPRRRLPKGRKFPPRHDIMVAVDGAAARALGGLARERWHRATGERVEETKSGYDSWPESLVPHGHDLKVAISRTFPAWNGDSEVREIERLTLDIIARAKRFLYIETQYFACPEIGEALAKRLGEDDGPEIVLVCSFRSPSYFDHMAMDPVRNTLIQKLKAADRHDRFRYFAPVTAKGAHIIVHSKAAFADDVILKIGSSNLNNRSMGFDTECDLSFYAEHGPADPAIATIRDFRHRLLAEHLATKPDVVAAEEARTGSLVATIEALNPQSGRRLAPVTGKTVSVFDGLFSAFDLLDPISPEDSWRPWRRRSGVRTAAPSVAEG